MCLAFAFAACGNKEEAATQAPSDGGQQQQQQQPADSGQQAQEPVVQISHRPDNPPMGTRGQSRIQSGYRIVRIASWFEPGMYMSDYDLDFFDGYAQSPEGHEFRYNRTKELEEKHKVKFEYIPMTFEGISISIDEGILSGRPEADMYLTDAQGFGITAALNEQLYGLEDLAKPTHDIFSTQKVFVPLKLDMQDKTYLFTNYTGTLESGVYVMGFNWTNLSARGLENPQDLWDRGEWTWDRFLDYLIVMTDLSPSAGPPVYGWGGLWTDALNMALRSNGANLAGTPQGGLTAPQTGEVLDLFRRIFIDLKVGRPWDGSDWQINNRYRDNSVAFFVATDWIFNGSGENYGGGVDFPLDVELGIVPWPVGPSGDKDRNFQNSVEGNFLCVPRGVENPALVYCAYVDLKNWYGGDFENTKGFDIIDDDDVSMSWSDMQMRAAARANTELADNNVRLAHFIKNRPIFDPWTAMQFHSDDGFYFGLVVIMEGTMTPAQFQETFRQPFENRLNLIYN
jgi:hypothetical protein